MRQIPLAIGPDPEPSFDSFVAGPNALAVELLASLALPGPPVYLWGPSGSGKTHLLRAWARQVRAAGGAVGGFEPSDGLPWALAPGWSLVVFDDCHALSEAQQQAVFAIFIEAQQQGVQVAAAGRWPPVDLPLREDLRTRLGWGHVLALQCLSEAETRAALRREADRRGIVLSDDVLGYLLTRFERDLKHLMTLLERLDRYALGEGRPVTVPLLKRMLADPGTEGGPTA